MNVLSEFYEINQMRIDKLYNNSIAYDLKIRSDYLENRSRQFDAFYERAKQSK